MIKMQQTARFKPFLKECLVHDNIMPMGTTGDLGLTNNSLFKVTQPNKKPIPQPHTHTAA